MAFVRGGPVLDHVQRYADHCEKVTGTKDYGTYPGHKDHQTRALDIFVPTDGKLAKKVADFTVEYAAVYGVDYTISRQKIWNPDVSPEWRHMTDRGSVTANHYDHNHTSFLPWVSKSAVSPSPKPTVLEGDVKWLAIHKNTGIWIVDGIHKVHINTMGVVYYWERQGVKWLPENKSEIQDDVFDNLVEVSP